MDYPLVSVIVPTFNREESLCALLEGLLKQDYSSYEIIIIDQTVKHTSQTLSFLKARQDSIRYYHLDQQGLPAARNFGLAQAKGEIILFCDDDVIPKEGLIKFHALSYQDQRIGAVAGRIDSAGQEQDAFSLFKPRLIGGKVSLSGRYFSHWTSSKKGLVFSGRGANFSFRKNLFSKLGGFDVRFLGTHSYEDVDFCYRLRREGSKIMYEPRAQVTHQECLRGGCNLEDKVKEEYSRFHNAALFYLKNMNKLFFPYMSSIFFLIALKKILCATRSLKDFTYVMKGLFDGYRDYRK